jgi:predicted amino acid-binding ACT domain protein
VAFIKMAGHDRPGIIAAITGTIAVGARNVHLLEESAR